MVIYSKLKLVSGQSVLNQELKLQKIFILVSTFQPVEAEKLKLLGSGLLVWLKNIGLFISHLQQFH